jgi:hypothetical protein
MTDLTATELYERILRSLKENSAKFEKKRRAERNRRILVYLIFGLVFAAGTAFGVFLVTSRLLAQITDSLG